MRRIGFRHILPILTLAALILFFSYYDSPTQYADMPPGQGQVEWNLRTASGGTLGEVLTVVLAPVLFVTQLFSSAGLEQKLFLLLIVSAIVFLAAANFVHWWRQRRLRPAAPSPPRLPGLLQWMTAWIALGFSVWVGWFAVEIWRGDWTGSEAYPAGLFAWCCLAASRILVQMWRWRELARSQSASADS